MKLKTIVSGALVVVALAFVLFVALGAVRF
jgi:hypothetical protein